MSRSSRWYLSGGPPPAYRAAGGGGQWRSCVSFDYMNKIVEVPNEFEPNRGGASRV